MYTIRTQYFPLGKRYKRTEKGARSRSFPNHLRTCELAVHVERILMRNTQSQAASPGKSLKK